MKFLAYYSNRKGFISLVGPERLVPTIGIWPIDRAIGFISVTLPNRFVISGGTRPSKFETEIYRRIFIKICDRKISLKINSNNIKALYFNSSAVWVSSSSRLSRSFSYSSVILLNFNWLSFHSFSVFFAIFSSCYRVKKYKKNMKKLLIIRSINHSVLRDNAPGDEFFGIFHVVFCL